MAGDTLLEDAGKAVNLASGPDLAGLGQRLLIGGIKAANRVPREADYSAMEIPELSGASYKSSLLVPTAYKESVELSLVPFMSNVGTYLQSKGFLGKDTEGEVDTSDALALPLDMVLDLGNLATAGTSLLLNAAGRAAETASILTKAGKLGTTGADVVKGAIDLIEQAGKAAKAMPEIVDAAKAGDRAAVQSILKAALKSGEMTPEAEAMAKGLRGDASAVARLLDTVGLRSADTPLAGILRDAEGIAGKGQLGPEAFLQATRAERLDARQVNPLLRITQPANPFRNPGAFFRQIVGVHYDGDNFYAPGSRLYAEGLDKMLPKAGEDVAREVSFNVLRDEARDFAGKLAEAEGRPADAPSLWHSQKLMDRLELISGLQTDHVVSQITGEQVDDDKVDKLVRRLYGYAPGTEVSEEQRASMKALAVNAANGQRAELDALTLADRDRTFQTILTRRMKSYEAFGMADSALAKADLADLRALHTSFNLTPIVKDPQGVGSAIAARVSTGRLYASQQGFIAREIVRAAYPNLHDADAVADVIGRIVEHMDLFEVKDGRLFLKADEATVKEAAPLLHHDLYSSADRRLLNSLTTDGLHPDVGGLVAQQRAYLDAVGPTLLHEGVIGGQIAGYFPHVFQPNAKFFKTFDVGEKTAGRFFERLMISADGGGELATQVLGAPLKGEFDGFLQAARQGKVTSQQTRELTEKLAVQFEKNGYGTYERDSLKVFAGYAAASNEALLVNRVIYDLPRSGVKLNRDALVAAVGESKADALIARLGGEEELNKIDRFHLGRGTVPEVLRDVFTPLTSQGRVGGGISLLTSDAEAVTRGLQGAARASQGAVAAHELNWIRDAYGELSAATKAEAEAAGSEARKAADIRIKAAKRGVEEMHARATKEINDKVAQGLAAIKESERLGRIGERKARAVSDRALRGAVGDIEAAEKELSALRKDTMLKSEAALNEAHGHLNDAAEMGKAVDLTVESHGKLAGVFQATAARHGMEQLAGELSLRANRARIRAETLRAYVGKLHAASAAKEERLLSRISAADRPVLEAELKGLAADEARRAATTKVGKAADADLAAMEKRWAERMAAHKFDVTNAQLEGIARVRRARESLDTLAKEYDEIVASAVRGDGAAKLAAENIAKKRIAGIVADLEPKVAGAAPHTVYAFKGDANPLIEALRLYPAEGHSAFASWYDTFNRNLKSVVLFGDFFYFNTLGVMQFVGAPEVALKTLMHDAALLPDVLKGGFGDALKLAIPGRNAAANMLAGAIVGGVAGQALDADSAQQTTTFSLAGALYGLAIGAAIRGGRAARLESVMGEHGIETLFWMGHAGWTGRPEDRAIGVLSTGLKKVYAKIANETAGQASVKRSVVEGLLHLADAYETTLYGFLHNGGKTVVFQHYWSSFLPKLEASQAFKDAVAKGDEEAQFFLKKKLATEIMQATNNAFGGNRYAALFGDPTVERHLRRFLVSPDYTASRLSFTAAMLGNMGPIKGAAMGAGLGQLIEYADAGFDLQEMQKRAGRGAIWGAAFGGLGAHWQRQVIRRMGTDGDVYANISRRMSLAALVGGFVTYNLMNKELTGHWMHENAPGKRLSVGLPNGQYLTPGKPFTEAFHFAGIMDTDRFPVPVLPFTANKLAPPLGIAKLIFNRDYYGDAIFTAEMSPRDQILRAASVAIDATSPIFLSQPIQSAVKFASGGGPPTEQDLVRTASDISGLSIRGRMGPAGQYDPEVLRMLTTAPARLPALGAPADLLESVYR